LILNFDPHDLPAVNAALNATATLLLILGYVLIKQGREVAHKRTMLTAFGVSCAFLVCYLIYHSYELHVPFRGPASLRPVYLVLLTTHIVLAATVPVLAIVTIYRGLRDQREKHRRIARWTFPIWLYVSITGVLIYLVLYQIYPASSPESIMSEPPLPAMSIAP
jgi:uncharacterized membrane protein YozB (DUF420 family)